MTNRKHMGIYQLQSSAGKFSDDSNVSHTRIQVDKLATYGDHARESGMASRQRVKLIAQALREHIGQSAKRSKIMAREALREVGAQAGLVVSKKLFKLAKRIEQKAEAVRHKKS